MTLRHLVQNYFYTCMIIAMVLILLLYPSLDRLHGGLGAFLLVDLTLIQLAVRMANDSPRLCIPLLVCTIIAVGVDLYSAAHVDRTLAIVVTAYFSLFYLYAIYVVLRQVLRPGPVNLDKISASLVIYVSVAILWSIVYEMIYSIDPASFTFGPASLRRGVQYFDFIYFSFVTLTTTGYGDILPTSHQVQAFAIVEQMVGVLYVAILIARLTNLYSVRSEADAPSVLE